MNHDTSDPVFRQKACRHLEATLALSGCTTSPKVQGLLQLYEIGLISSAELVTTVKALHSTFHDEQLASPPAADDK